jgi:N-acetyl-anhydromuramyl-L-alanine amidase AmpD
MTNDAQQVARPAENGIPVIATSGLPPKKRSPFVLVRPLLRRSVALRTLLVIGLVVALIPAGLFMHAHAMRQPQPPLSLPYAFVQSCNCDDRPPDAVVNCIVLHATVEPTTEGTMGIFLTPQRRVSAHFVVGRDGRVVQMVRAEQRAWHAGSSILDGVERVNDYSIGIEMVNLNDGTDPYPQAQMEAVAGIIRHIRSKYDVPDARIVGHGDVALPHGRKTDPVGFDFDRLRTMARTIPGADNQAHPRLALP